MFDSCTRVHAYVTQMTNELTKVHTNDTWHLYVQAYLPLADQNVSTWHLPLACSIIPSPCPLKRNIVISSIPICYVKHHDASILFTLKKTTYVVLLSQVRLQGKTQSISI